MKTCCENVRDVWKRFRTPVLILTAIYALEISAIVRANFYYIDDMGRAFWGYRGFYYFGRYVSQYGSVLLHADAHLTDISPFPQLLAIVILAVSAVIILHQITGRDQFRWLEYAAAVPIGLSPYFLECISYKFDSPFMAISILASVVPILFAKRGKIPYFLSIVVGMLTVCMSYQAASGIFPMLVVILALKQWNERENWKEIIKFSAFSAAGYLVGMLIFAVAIMKPGDDYVATEVPTIAKMIPTVAHNLKEYYYYVFTDFKKEWLLLIAVLCVSFVYTMVRESKQKWYYALVVNGAAVLLLFGMAFGLYPVLKLPLFEPRAMYGFGVCLGLICIVVASAKGSRCYAVGKCACLVLCWCFFIFGFTYGNALYVQKTYTDYRICAVIDDLDEAGLLHDSENKLVQISGSIGKAPGMEAMRQDYQMLNRLVPTVFSDSSWDWGRFGFENYYGLGHMKWDSSVDLREQNLPIVCESVYHTIRADSDSILIELK